MLLIGVVALLLEFNKDVWLLNHPSSNFSGHYFYIHNSNSFSSVYYIQKIMLQMLNFLF